MANIDFRSADYLHKQIRIAHNREIIRWFKDVPDNNTNSGRAGLKAALRIYKDDSNTDALLKITHFQMYIRKLKGIDAVATVPEDYEIKAQSKRPQLVIIFRPTSNAIKSGNYSFVIPHYNGNKTPTIKPYDKGNYWARLILKDNSYLRINGKTETEALNYLKSLKKFINKKYLTDDITTGVYHAKPFKEIKLKPIRADFYPKGKEEMFPLWRHYF